MIRKSITCILCWCWCITLAAQTSEIDSLKHLLNSVRNNNMEKSRLLIELSNEFLSVDTGKCKMYAIEAVRTAQLTGSEVAEGAAYNTLGNFYQVANQPYLAHVNYKKAEKLFIKHQDWEDLYQLYNNLMLLFLDIEDTENTAYYAGKVQEIAIERNDLPVEIEAQFILGWARFEDNEGEEALDYYLDLHRKSIPLDTTITYFLAANCGRMFILQNRPIEALNYLHSARRYFEVDGMMAMPEIYGCLAEAYAMTGRVDSAEYYIKKAQNSPLVTDDTKKILYHSRSVLDSYRGDYLGALAHFKSYHHLYDSIAQAGKTAEIARMKNWHELEQKDNENEILQQEKQEQRKLILILAAALLMILALLFLSILYYRKTVEKNYELKKLHTVKDKLFTVVAHDLRSPISALISVLKLTNRDMLDAETRAQLLKDISTRVDDTYGLLDNLLRWAKSQMQGIVPVFAYFDVQDASLLVTESLQNVASSKTITLSNHIASQQVFADRDMFGVVVRNLTTNAIKYTSEGGDVTLSSELSDGKLVISVKDTGTGMSQDVQDKLFNFSETKSRRGTGNESGTGLGLVLCADFVKANGGRIWFTSVPGEGSTFFFSIPMKN